MFVFYFDKVPTLAKLELMCFVCVGVVWEREMWSLHNCSLYQQNHLNTYRLNNASLYKGLLLIVYTHNENKTLCFYNKEK